MGNPTLEEEIMKKNKKNSDELVYAITVEDLQYESMEKIGRELNEEEIYIAKKGLESRIGFGLDIIYETIFDEMIEK